MTKFLTSEVAGLAIFMCKCAKVKKNEVFLIAQADLRRLGSYLYIIYILVKPNYGPDIRTRLSLLGVIYGKSEFFTFSKKTV